MLIDQQTEARYIPLNHIRDGQARYEVINSMLSEEAVLGFEYGYTLAEPNALTFGRRSSATSPTVRRSCSTSSSRRASASGCACRASSACCRTATKAQEPEHSSARLERYLQLCAEDNMQVVNITTPANFFHVLRRQLKRPFRKPLIVMTPKSMLRNKRAVSPLDRLASGTAFHRILLDKAETWKNEKIKLAKDDKIRRVVISSGKVYWDLYDEREKRGIDDVYLLRCEQLYPFPLKQLVRHLSRFKKAEVVWCQEEPKNMGAWFFVEPYLEWVLGQVSGKSKRARYAGRPAAAATATGLMPKHLAQLKAFLDECFG